jgi:serine/threonine-protein kinase
MSSPDAPITPVKEGDVLAGKYRVERVLGVGGMGAVVAATHLQLGTRVALKFLLPEAALNADFVGRFSREARAAASIKSEHVARVSDVGTLENGSPYIVMEHLEGRDLASVIEEKGATLDPATAVDYVLQASEAIAEAHAMGIVHRDIKPANLFLAARPGGVPVVKVLDFGIAKQTGAADAGLTRTATLVGSPLYMSPEQLTDTKGIDTRTDIWSLGVTLYELLAGVTPFVGDSMPMIVGLILSGRYQSLSEVRPDVPEGLATAIARCIRPREERFANVAEMAMAFGPFAPAASVRLVERVSRILSLPSMPPPSAMPVHAAMMAKTLPAQTQAAWGGTGASTASTKKRTFVVLGATAASAMLVGVMLVVLRLGHGATAPAVPAPAIAPLPLVTPAAPQEPPKAELVLAPAPSVTAATPSPSAAVSAPELATAAPHPTRIASPRPNQATPPPPSPAPTGTPRDTNPLHIQLK